MSTSRLPARNRSQAGFSLVEVLVAMIVLAVGLLGMAGATALMIRTVGSAELRTERTMAVQTAIERIRSFEWNTHTSGSDTVGAYSVKWTSNLVGSNARRFTIVAVGPGIASGQGGAAMVTNTVADTVTYTVMRP
jgi:prepilin-type N-terminal cleavage/methylation domain-containing protein